MSRIDFVVLWVDSNDTEWQKVRSRYLPQKGDDISIIRYRDWDNLRYWFRSVEKHAPWVNAIHFVTCGQIPEWLNTENEKLRIIHHKDYMPLDALPTFNSSAIEVGIHRIPGLSDRFVFFNDDMFINDDISEDYFFHNGVPVDTAGLAPPPIAKEGNAFSHILYNDLNIINENFNKGKVIKANYNKWLKISYRKALLRTLLNLYRIDKAGFINPHLSTPYRKNDFQKVWEKYELLLQDTEFHRFRSNNDLSHFLFKYWRLCESEFYPRRLKGKYFGVNSMNDAKKAASAISKSKYPEICINDCYTGEEFNTIRNIINQAFEEKYSNKSSFEV